MDSRTASVSATNSSNEMPNIEHLQLSESLSHVLEGNTPAEQSQPQEPRVDWLKEIPPELRYMIVDNLTSTKDVFSVARTCHTLLRAVNGQVKFLAPRLCAEQRARISKSFPSMSINHQTAPQLKDLTILEALRKSSLYNGRLQHWQTHAMIHQLAGWYEREQGVFTPPAPSLKKTLLEEMFEYLLHVDVVKHPYDERSEYVELLRHCKHKESVFCKCLTCTGVTSRGTQGAHCYVDVEVWKFELSGWDMAYPLRFFREASAKATKKWVADEEAWLDMVRSVLEEPIQQYNKQETTVGSECLMETIFNTSPVETLYQSTSRDIFLADIGLPLPDLTLHGWTCTYIPKMNAADRRHLLTEQGMVSSEEIRGLWKETRGMRAVREYFTRPCGKEVEGRLLDPFNYMLPAVLCEEMQITRKVDSVDGLEDDLVFAGCIEICLKPPARHDGILSADEGMST
ncbi:hypothetical protein M409DRAFT_54662 [Zasmidium cellare ATCC 36951]|uniref:F-box domain-containing protein n=1 Tax=Zasmidium cellare ATCC 36951 TaxID=1080233 RepID=A0A6A6CL06_ZASCE|nr:uncharacterized protein M409DRAFT_54662 [Zasmidium cellare ATCC 36951]KAF2166888.1 hypothetical protein M409DRAFT_54662 [Zasmidium cellare ATCC 36951]